MMAKSGEEKATPISTKGSSSSTASSSSSRHTIRTATSSSSSIAPSQQQQEGEEETEEDEETSTTATTTVASATTLSSSASVSFIDATIATASTSKLTSSSSSLHTSSWNAGAGVQQVGGRGGGGDDEEEIVIDTLTCSGDEPHHYEQISLIGSGAYGHVYKARDKRSPIGQVVALKKVRIPASSDGVPVSLIREISLLRTLESFNHPNIVKLLDVCQGQQMDREKCFFLYLIFEHVDQDLAVYLENVPSPGLSPDRIKEIIFLILKGIDFLHSHRIVHRDIKPQNVLVASDGQIKIADFGLARIYEQTQALTSVVVTLWYRAPEVLLANSYASSLDLWSCGCIFAELFTRKPLFQGSSEIDQLHSIFRVIGSPDESDWPSDSAIPYESIRSTTVTVTPTATASAFPPSLSTTFTTTATTSASSSSSSASRNQGSSTPTPTHPASPRAQTSSSLSLSSTTALDAATAETLSTCIASTSSSSSSLVHKSAPATSSSSTARRKRTTTRTTTTISTALSKLIPHMCSHANLLMQSMLDFNATTRITARDALRHEYFHEYINYPPTHAAHYLQSEIPFPRIKKRKIITESSSTTSTTETTSEKSNKSDDA